jgi:hypothetical protein
MPQQTSDDVIRIRVDTTRAVEDFLALLREQAAEGETRAPANPAATAIWRELAPFRLVEYAYVDDAVGTIQGAFVGFPDGSLHAAGGDIPEDAVTGMVLGHEHEAVALPPIYIYLLLASPAAPAAVERYLGLLSGHAGQPLVAVLCDGRGGVAPRIFDASPAGAPDARLDGAASLSLLEGDRHLSKAQVLECLADRVQRPDGRTYATLTYAYAQQTLEFASPAGRDDFIMWTRRLCDWLDDHEAGEADPSFPEAHRPAEPAPVPADDRPVVRLAPPSAFEGGSAWGLFDGEGGNGGGARGYWAYVRLTIDAVRQGTGF